MIPPFVSFVTFNRLGLTIRNLEALLNTTDDFELNIVDSNSSDNTWDFLQSLKDDRIKSITRLPENKGPIYALNYNLSKRKPGQYFITIDSDVHMITKDWITRFMRVFDAFPDVGLLAVPFQKPHPRLIPPVKSKRRNGVGYLKFLNKTPGIPFNFIQGHCQCLRPELIEKIGYWSEELASGDGEISVRINRYTRFKTGFIEDIEIDMNQHISCIECKGQDFCSLDRDNLNCFKILASRHKNRQFIMRNVWKYYIFFKDIETGARTAYCASIHDPESIKKHKYNYNWAMENFDFYAKNTN